VAAGAERPAAVGDDLPLVRRLADDGRFERINHALVMADRERSARRQPLGRDHRQPSVKTTDPADHALRCGQEGQRRKRHALVDTTGVPCARTASGPASRIATAADRLCGLRAASSRSSNGSSRQRVCRSEGRQGHVDRGRNRAQETPISRLRC